MKSKLLLFGLILFLAFTACNKDKVSTYNASFHATPYQIKIPKYFPTLLNIPADNPMTVEGIRLGRYLFYDGRLSGRTEPDSLMSCCTCHIQANAFECGINNSHFIGGATFGLTGIPTPHHMLPMINLVFNSNGYLWSGFINKNNTALGNAAYGVPAQQPYNYTNIESVVWMAITAPHEINGTIEKTVNMIKSIPMYPPMFKAAFGTEEINIDRISKAIAQFVRTLISSNSKFDKYLRGETNLTSDEFAGYVLFVSENGGDCFHCHGGSGNPLFTTNLFYNNGMDSIFNDPRDHSQVTHNVNDKGSYKAPTLRNIMYTAPYMHDGRFNTIDEVLTFYNSKVIFSPYISPLMHHANNGGIQLTNIQLQQLKTFLTTLSDSDFVTDTTFSKPSDLK